jgi:predicted nucleotide-binding protein
MRDARNISVVRKERSMPERPMVFVASSSEQLPVAQRIRDGLRSSKEWDVNVWTTQFAFSATYIDSLERALDDADFAVVVMTGDDQANVRKDAVVLPRDNVIFELGLFIGRLGRERCAFFHDASRDTRIASDLEGVKGADFYPDDQADGKARRKLADRVREVRSQIKQVLQEAGPRYKIDRGTRDLQQQRWRVIKQMEGYWWERMRKGDDDASALSLVTVSAVNAGNSVRLDGKAFDLTDRWFASWAADADLELTPVPTLHYRWEGWLEGQKAAAIAGLGSIKLDRLEFAPGGPFYGSYFDTRLAEMRDGLAPTREKRFSFARLADEDLTALKDPLSDVARRRIADVRARLAWG